MENDSHKNIQPLSLPLSVQPSSLLNYSQICSVQLREDHVLNSCVVEIPSSPSSQTQLLAYTGLSLIVYSVPSSESSLVSPPEIIVPKLKIYDKKHQCGISTSQQLEAYTSSPSLINFTFDQNETSLKKSLVYSPKFEQLLYKDNGRIIIQNYKTKEYLLYDEEGDCTYAQQFLSGLVLSNDQTTCYFVCDYRVVAIHLDGNYDGGDKLVFSKENERNTQTEFKNDFVPIFDNLLVVLRVQGELEFYDRGANIVQSHQIARNLEGYDNLKYSNLGVMSLQQEDTEGILTSTLKTHGLGQVVISLHVVKRIGSSLSVNTQWSRVIDTNSIQFPSLIFSRLYNSSSSIVQVFDKNGDRKTAQTYQLNQEGTVGPMIEAELHENLIHSFSQGLLSVNFNQVDVQGEKSCEAVVRQIQ